MLAFVRLISTFFYIGLVPAAPGTVASFAALLLIVCFYDMPLALALFFILSLGLGFLLSGRAEKIFGKKDPSEVVIDEVAGLSIVFLGVPLHWVFLATGFLLYRLLDIFKPLGLRRLEKLRGSYGIMADDLAAGIYTHLCLRYIFVPIFYKYLQV